MIWERTDALVVPQVRVSRSAESSCICCLACIEQRLEQGAQFKCVFDVAQQLIPFEGDQFVAESAKIVQKNARAG